MRLYLSNTATRQKELFQPQNPDRVTMYVCGPTVYNYAHIGNARPAVVFDVLFRVLRLIYGPERVVYARNITDVDDKIIRRAEESGESIEVITERYARIYQEDMHALGVLAPSVQPRATDHVQGMLALIAALEAKGFAYRTPMGVNFAVQAFPEYGKLSHRALDDLQAGARVEVDEAKRHPADFALWKAAKPGEPFWDGPFGPGRPGWHIECSAMAQTHLGDTVDIHGGGHDLIFPHHENEIAQSECAHGKPLARYWLHNGFLTMEQEKMSKSLGNVFTVHELLEKWPGEVLRWALLSAHYRAPLDWTDALLEQAKASLNRLYGALERLEGTPAANVAPPEQFLEPLLDDLNTPGAMAALFDLAAQANKAEAQADKARLKGELLAAGALLGVLGQTPKAWFQGSGDEAEIEGLVAARAQARAAKNWAEADRLRGVLTEKGVEVLDGAGGSTWRRIN